MSKFVIQPHFRLQEWVAEEKGYFKNEGLDYVFQETVKATDGKSHATPDKSGAMQTFEALVADQVPLIEPIETPCVNSALMIVPSGVLYSIARCRPPRAHGMS